jgi:glutathione S-transferase
MIEWRSLADVIGGPGLRMVLVQGIASPWGVAAKTLFDLKGVPVVAAPWVAGEANDAAMRWSGADSAPVVIWNDEQPVHRWLDILHLAERVAPNPRLVPEDPAERALMIGLSFEICGEGGLGWNRRLQLFAPMMEAADPPPGVVRMAAKYGYSRPAAHAARDRVIAQLGALAQRLEAQYAAGRDYFIGDSLTALDVYFVAFLNLVALQPAEECPMAEAWRTAYRTGMDEPTLAAAVRPILLEHRDRIYQAHFRKPLEF